MTALLLDIGNSRIKWALARAGRLGRQRALPYAGTIAAGDALRELLTTLAGRRAPVRRVIAVSVAGARVDRQLTTQCRERLQLTPQFVRSERHAAGVRSGYREVWRLGADRWVALVGAHALVPNRAICVADVGTALTIDLLDPAGRHLGGAIVPGPGLMVSALLRDTRGIQRRAGGRSVSRGAPASLFARDTATGLRAGGAHAAAAVIDRACEDASRRLGRAPVLLLTGGAAPPLRRLLRSRHRHVPDLVLRGLQALLQAERN